MDALEIVIQRKEDGSPLQGQNCNEGVNGCEGHASRPRQSDQRRGLLIRLESPGLKQSPAAQLHLNRLNVPAKTLEDFITLSAVRGRPVVSRQLSVFQKCATKVAFVFIGC
jgi:hypothetical protein